MVGGVRSNPSGRATLSSGLREPDPRRGVKRLVFMSGVAGDSDVSDAQSVGQDSQMPAPTKLTTFRCPRPGAGSIGAALVL